MKIFKWLNLVLMFLTIFTLSSDVIRLSKFDNLHTPASFIAFILSGGFAVYVLLITIGVNRENLTAIKRAPIIGTLSLIICLIPIFIIPIHNKVFWYFIFYCIYFALYVYFAIKANSSIRKSNLS